MGPTVKHCQLMFDTDRAQSQVAGDMNASERRALNIRLDPTLVGALDAAAIVAPTLSRHAIARAALFIGLEAVTRDPVLLLQPAGVRRTSKKRRASKRAAK